MNVDRLNLDAWSGRVDPEADSPRWHQRIQALSVDSQPGLALLGFACDEGVRRNGGRAGAAEGPPAIRAALARLTPDVADADRFAELARHVRDLGDVGPTGDLDTDLQRKLQASLTSLQRRQLRKQA